MFKKLHKMFKPVTLSRGLEIVNDYKTRHGYIPSWYNMPVNILIEVVGDIPLVDVNEDHIAEWNDAIKSRRHAKTGKLLSPYTVDSYIRGLKAYFNHLVKMGHLEKSPADSLIKRKLPRTNKNAIKEHELDMVLVEASRHLLDHAVVLMLRDTGARAGEIASLTVDRLNIDECRALVYDQKTNEMRPVFFTEECADVLRRYSIIRPDGAGDMFFLNNQDNPLGYRGVYHLLKRVGKRVGVDTHPHAFRHRFAKQLKLKRVDPEVISRLLGHKDVTTYQRVYGTTTDEELATYYQSLFTSGGIDGNGQSPHNRRE